MGNRLVARHLPTQESTAQIRGHRSMSRAEFEPTFPVFECSKTIRALDCAATGAGGLRNDGFKFWKIILYNEAFVYIFTGVSESISDLWNIRTRSRNSFIRELQGRNTQTFHVSRDPVEMTTYFYETYEVQCIIHSNKQQHQVLL
jgi:hypothetical protein